MKESNKTHENFNFLSLDISDFVAIENKLPAFIKSVEGFDLIILNAGILGEIKDLKDTSLHEIKKVMDVNVWANKLLIDICFENLRGVDQIVAISSGASQSGSRGWSAYALSKVTLNMLISLYAAEQKRTHFSAITPGLVDTQMQDYISGLPDDEHYPVVQKLKKAKNTPDMPAPSEVAEELIEAFGRAMHYRSGSFLDKREL